MITLRPAFRIAGAKPFFSLLKTIHLMDDSGNAGYFAANCLIVRNVIGHLSNLIERMLASVVLIERVPYFVVILEMYKLSVSC